MKRVIFILLAVFMASVSYAQLSWDARVGVNLSGVSEGNMTMKFGLKGGVGAEFGFSDLFALRSGLFFSMKGVSDAKNPFDLSPDNTFRLNYMEIPMLASFRFPVCDKFSMAFNAGPSLGYRVSKKKDWMGELKSFDVGIDAGIDFILNKKFVIGVEGQYGLSQIVKGNNDLHNINYSLLFGYKF